MITGKVSRRVFSKEFKAEAVALALSGAKSAAQIAADLGISDNVLYRWIRQYRESAEVGIKAFPGRGRPRDEELARLRKENKALKETNEILKKVAVIFAQESPR